MSKWNYGNAYLRHPIGNNTIVFDNESKVKVHDIFEPLPVFMKLADLLFIDPPWNTGNLNTFYTKANIYKHHNEFKSFYNRVFECIKQINPKTCYIEVGKEYLAEFILETKAIFKHVTFYNSSYYHKKDNFCYVIRGSHKRKKLPLDYMDEEDIIKWICANEDYNCIGDLCMGRGLVGLHAYKNDKKFVGTELNHKRLSVLIENIVKNGGKYEYTKA